LEVILKYFPSLTEDQINKFSALFELYKDWNEKINLVSRKDIDSLYLHHVLHSLAIAKYIRFQPGSKVLDLGTGGGFPGIPLAIFFPETKFILVDSIAKKIKVVEDIAAQLDLQNVEAKVSRVESLNVKVDFIVTRAVANLKDLVHWSLKHLNSKSTHAMPNGLIALKGPAFKLERKELPKKDYVESYPIGKWFSDSYFEEKFLVYVQGR